MQILRLQIEDPKQVVRVLSKELEMDEDTVRKRVEKVLSASLACIAFSAACCAYI